MTYECKGRIIDNARRMIEVLRSQLAEKEKTIQLQGDLIVALRRELAQAKREGYGEV